jgi:hypothetical protein
MPSTKLDPVRVYLDSKDISYLADTEKLASNASLRQAREELVDLGHKGIAEFRFSFFHIIELAHLAAEHKHRAEERVRFVKALCGNRAYLHPDKLRRVEGLSLVQDGQPETARGAMARAYVTDASWMPECIVSVADRFTDALVRGLHNRIAKQSREVLDTIEMDAATRAAMEEKFISPQGVTKEAADIAAKTPEMFFGNWQIVYPLTKRFWDEKMLLRHLQGVVSLDELRRECLSGFADLENFIGWCVDEIPCIRDMRQTLRSTGQSSLFDELRKNAGQRVEVAGEILDQLDLEPKDRAWVLRSLKEDLQAATAPNFEKARRKELEELYQSNPEWFDAQGVTKEQFESGVAASALGAMPSLDAFLHVVMAHFKKLAKLSANHPRLQRSDLADLR